MTWRHEQPEDAELLKLAPVRCSRHVFCKLARYGATGIPGVNLRLAAWALKYKSNWSLGRSISMTAGQRPA